MGHAMDADKRWLAWAVELQSLAQAGLTYGKDGFDLERYARIREISAEILAHMTGLPAEKVTGLFCNETGYQTPKLDTRAAVFQDGKILLVRERDGRWALPGGWCDVNVSVGENTVKEVKEEAGLDVIPRRIIAVQDRAKHNLPVYAYGVCKIFVQCDAAGGQFTPNLETTEARYFPPDQLPPLAEEKNTPAQIALCFEAYRSDAWATHFD